ncbi:hypothetical protein M3Y99_00068300 [Aphelenchoides fujianensis]|nr:hypothetical protein M3Y99_00068300 [Aphelenchoides fujianensis]
MDGAKPKTSLTAEDLRSHRSESPDEHPGRPNVWAEIAGLLRPIMGVCGRPCREKKWKNAKPTCRRKSRAVDQDQLWPLENCRRAKSEAWLCGSNSIKVSCVECSPERRKKVCFGGKTTNEECTKSKANGRCSPPRPILCRKGCEPPTALEHMDFATFKAWRRGSRLSEDVLNHPLGLDAKGNKLEQLMKNFMSACVVQPPHRPIADM